MMARQEIPNKKSDQSRRLAGRRILVTRARSQASSLVERLANLGGEIIEFPTIEIRPPESYALLDDAIRRIASYDWLIFTSVNGVEAFLGRLVALGRRVRDLPAVKIAAIGPETAQRLSAAQIQPTLVPERYQAEGLLDMLSREAVRGQRILLPRAAQARDILPVTLREWGARVDVVEAYQTALPTCDVAALRLLLRERRIDMITFTSSSTATHFAAILRGDDLSLLLSGIAIACIGPITQKTVESLGLRAEVVSQEFTIPGLVEAIVDYFDSRDGSGGHSRSVGP
jgi:uroporphyrinogen III methyltransferase / synthase